MDRKQKHRLLLKNEYYVPLYPRLSMIIGRNEAIIFSLIYYWLTSKKKSGQQFNGIRWIYNSYHQWQEQCCDMSVGSLKRAIKNLSEFPLIAVTNKFSSAYGLPPKTNWYTIIQSNLELLETFFAINSLSKVLDKTNLQSWMSQKSHYPMGQIVPIDTLYIKEHIKENSTENITNSTTDVFNYLTRIGFKKFQAKNILGTYDSDYVLEKLRVLSDELRRGVKISSPCGFIIKALDENYFPSIETERKLEKEKMMDVNKRLQVCEQIRQSLNSKKE